MTTQHIKDENLQEYLETFEVNDNEEEEEITGTYFVDEAGNYYYQATPDSEPVPTIKPEGMIEEDEEEEDQGNDVGMEAMDVEKEEIYEFDENEEVEEHEVIEGDLKPDMRLISGVKFTKTIIQPKEYITEDGGVFPCTHCNYVSNKRYLLARHMKSHSDDRPVSRTQFFEITNS